MKTKFTLILASLTLVVSTGLFMSCAQTASSPTAAVAAAAAAKVLPTLTAGDFQNFLQFYPLLTQDPASALQQIASQGINADHFEGVVTKVLGHLKGISSPDALSALTSQYGDSALLNTAEQALFDQYKPELLKLVGSALLK